jgi:LysM repeat protein
MIKAATYIFSNRYTNSALLAVIAAAIFSTTGVTAQIPSDNLIPITANQVQNSWAAENKSNYYYTFIAKPGELRVILNAESDRGSGTVSAIVMDENRRQLGSITTLPQERGTQKHNERTFKITQRQQLIIQIAVDNYYPQKGAFLGRFNVQLQGNIEAPKAGEISSANEVQNSWAAENKSNYYYTFIANPGELRIMLNAQSDRGSGTVSAIVMDENRRQLGSITTLPQERGSQKHNGRTFKITQRQQLTLQVAVDNYYPQKGAFLGKFKVQFQGNIESLKQI